MRYNKAAIAVREQGARRHLSLIHAYVRDSGCDTIGVYNRCRWRSSNSIARMNNYVLLNISVSGSPIRDCMGFEDAPSLSICVSSVLRVIDSAFPGLCIPVAQ